MSKRAIWIVGAIIAVVAGLVIGLFVFAGDADEAATASPTATATATPAPTQSPSPTASETPTPTAISVTCATISTDEFHSIMAENGFVSWETTDEQIGAQPFDAFPGGPPEDQIVCRWGEGQDIPTDNVIDLAWAPLAAGDQSGAQDYLVAQGYTRSNRDEGALFSIDGGDGYLFTDSDVRWAPQADYLQYIQSPDAAQ
ncbi:hypothetical protein [Microbacterium sp. NPDC076911]|uniref:hypothetical protein n=1 Tax=Microbacterium sp. NPDC076911 TaxID=3154958 RepID=UPI003417D23C